MPCIQGYDWRQHGVDGRRLVCPSNRPCQYETPAIVDAGTQSAAGSGVPPVEGTATPARADVDAGGPPAAGAGRPGASGAPGNVGGGG